jgi:hypothetical protein
MDLDWKAGKLSKVTIRNINGKACKVRYNGNMVELSLEKGKVASLNGELVVMK